VNCLALTASCCDIQNCLESHTLVLFDFGPLQPKSIVAISHILVLFLFLYYFISNNHYCVCRYSHLCNEPQSCGVFFTTFQTDIIYICVCYVIICSKAYSHSSHSAISGAVSLQVGFRKPLVSVCAAAKSVARWNASRRWKL